MRLSPTTSLLLCSLLGLSFGTSACFVDSDPDEGTGDEGSTTGDVETTGAGPASGISASATASQSSTAPVTTDSTSDTMPDPPGTTGTTTGLDDSTMGTNGTSETSTGATVLRVDDLEIGDLVITEVMINPNCDSDDCEWIEVLNGTAQSVDLQGLGVGDHDDAMSNSASGVIAASVVIPPGGLAVLVQQSDAWPYSAPFDAEYGSPVAFTNGEAESAALFNSQGEILDQTATFFAQSPDAGRSLSLQPDSWDANANDDSGNWCLSDTFLESEGISDDWGTPGSPEVTCMRVGA